MGSGTAEDEVPGKKGDAEEEDEEGLEEEDDEDEDEDDQPFLQPVVENQAEALATRVADYLQQFEVRIVGQLESLRRRCEDVVESAVRQMETRLKALEDDGPKVKRRIRRLGRNVGESVAGCTEEGRAQRRRVEAIETKQREWWMALEEGLHALLAELEGTLQRGRLGAAPLEQGLWEQVKGLPERLREADLDLPALVTPEASQDYKTGDQRSAEVFAKLLQLHRDALDSRARLSCHEEQLETLRKRLGLDQDTAVEDPGGQGAAPASPCPEGGQLRPPCAQAGSTPRSADDGLRGVDNRFGGLPPSSIREGRSPLVDRHRLSESEESSLSDGSGMDDASDSEQSDDLSEA